MKGLETQPARASGEFAVGGDLSVVRLGYGAMQIPGPGVWGEPRDPDEIIRVLRRAIELGVTLIDTADSYGPEVSERYNLADRHAEPVLEYCQRENIGFIPWFPMATGRLAEADGPLQRIADEQAVTPAQLALAWLLQRSPVLLSIPGTSTVAHLEDNVGAALIELTPDQVQQLDAAG